MGSLITQCLSAIFLYLYKAENMLQKCPPMNVVTYEVFPHSIKPVLDQGDQLFTQKTPRLRWWKMQKSFEDFECCTAVITLVKVLKTHKWYYYIYIQFPPVYFSDPKRYDNERRYITALARSLALFSFSDELAIINKVLPM